MREAALIGGMLALMLGGGPAHAADFGADSQAVPMSGVPYISASPLTGIKIPRQHRSLEPGAFAPEPGLDTQALGLRAGDSLGSEPAPLLASPRRVIEPGWHFSGRVGPLRWLTPLDGDGDTQLRFGGRVYGQPRMPGTGNINIGINYNF